MSYYIMECLVDPTDKIADFLPYDDFLGSWISGSKLVELPPDPIALTWDPDNESGVRKSYYGAGEGLMLKSLVAALQDAGVDNLDVYSVTIRSTRNDEICNDYVAVNIIGKIAAVDMEKSEVIDMGMGGGMIDVMFDSLVIDEKKTNGMLLFRLAESVGVVVVHEKVVNKLQSQVGFGLTFTKPEDYCG